MIENPRDPFLFKLEHGHKFHQGVTAVRYLWSGILPRTTGALFMLRLRLQDRDREFADAKKNYWKKHRDTLYHPSQCFWPTARMFGYKDKKTEIKWITGLMLLIRLGIEERQASMEYQANYEKNTRTAYNSLPDDVPYIDEINWIHQNWVAFSTVNEDGKTILDEKALLQAISEQKVPSKGCVGTLHWAFSDMRCFQQLAAKVLGKTAEQETPESTKLRDNTETIDNLRRSLQDAMES